MLNNHDFSVSIFCPSMAMGGAEKAVLNLIHGFVTREVDVTLLLAKAEGPLLSSLPNSANLVDLGARRVLFSLPKLCSYLRKQLPTILISVQAHANLVAIWAKELSRVSTKLIVSAQTTLSVNAAKTQAFSELAIPIFVRFAYPKADAVVAVSQGVAEDLEKVIGVPGEKIHVIYNPVVTPMLLEQSEDIINHPWFSFDSPPVIVALGRLTAAKDWPTLLRAFSLARKNSRVHLVIIGEGEERPALETLINELRIEGDVSLPGFVSNPYAFLSKGNLFVLSSRWEGLPTVLIEAMACGVPVIATNCPSGPDEILDHGKFGSLVPVGDVEALAKAILRVLDCPPDTSQSRERAMAFSMHNATERYLTLIRSMIATTE